LIALLCSAPSGFAVEGSTAAAPHLTIKAAAPFVLYVPEVQVFGGSIGFAGALPYGAECGRQFGATPWS
jgi:hypothetical protein